MTIDGLSVDLRGKALVFTHIPKVGGLTLEGALEKKLLGLRGNADDIEFHTGHRSFGIHEELDRPATYMAFVRNPLDRLVSTYYFCRARPDDHYPMHRAIGRHIVEHDLSLERFILDAVEQLGIADVQTRFVSGAEAGDELPYEPLGPDSLATALHNLEHHFSMIGLTERFDESLVLLLHTYGWDTLSYAHRNTSAGAQRDPVTDEMAAHVRAISALDWQLYEACTAIYDERVARLARHVDIDREIRRLAAGNERYQRLYDLRIGLYRRSPAWMKKGLDGARALVRRTGFRY